MGLALSVSFGQSGNKFEAPIRKPVWVLDDNNDLGITSMLPDVKSTLDTNSLDTPRKCWCTKEFLEFVKKLNSKISILKIQIPSHTIFVVENLMFILS